MAVEPEFPYDANDLACTVVTGSVDPDGDPVGYRYAWSVDGTDAGVEVPFVDHAATAPGQTWTCVVTPSDGREDGPTAAASVTVAADPVPDEPPSAPVVAITPAAPQDGDELRCVVVEPGVDPEGAAVTHAFAWAVDAVDAGWTDDAVPAERTSVGETWTCAARASDGVEVGPEATASVVIGVDFDHALVDAGFLANVSCVTPPVFTDLTGDGRVDLLCTDAVDRMVAMAREGDAGTPRYTGFWYVEHPGCCGDDEQTLAAGVLREGGLPAVLVAYGDGDERGYSGSAHVYPNDGGTLAAAPTWTLLGSAGLSSWSQSARAADVDDDGAPELLVTSLRPYDTFPSDGVRLFDVDAAGVPTDLLWSDEPIATGVDVADLDGDGLAELLVCGTDRAGDHDFHDNEAAWAARLYTGGAAPTRVWTAPTTVADGADAGCAFADFDGDGDQDVIVVSETDAAQGLRAFENVDGVVAALPSAYTPTPGRGLDVADWDGDGREELLVANPSARTTHVVDLGEEVEEASVLCGWGRWLDWDEDGAPDMACLPTDTGGVYLYRAE